ncbi:hypothetical protein BDV39DRAFT_166461 [Aspergillus sergii]|uniref:Uncharacterized protein n=1 Tax=Aspergillus sergii TaxID=1034303 RepID=A0A5N6XIV6_9EURO|nr:hypothetical protein BDV39DRAFT_166461 [Aspergillus sergii]
MESRHGFMSCSPIVCRMVMQRKSLLILVSLCHSAWVVVRARIWRCSSRSSPVVRRLSRTGIGFFGILALVLHMHPGCFYTKRRNGCSGNLVDVS